MKHAPNTPTATTLPKTTPGRLTAGLDWAKDDHVVCVLDDHGEVVDRFTLEHSSAGLAGLIRRLGKLGCREVAIEQPDGPVVDALLDAAWTSAATNSLSSPKRCWLHRFRYRRYSSSGSRSRDTEISVTSRPRGGRGSWASPGWRLRAPRAATGRHHLAAPRLALSR